MRQYQGLLLKKISFVRTIIFVCSLPILMGLRFIDAVTITHGVHTPLHGFSRYQIERDLGALSPKTRKHIDTMARTIYGEARGEKDDQALLAVAHVILNRAAHKNWGDSPKKVALERAQFSCWNANDPNCQLLGQLTLEDPHFRRAYRAAIVAMQRTEDPTNGATHYHSVHLKRKPKWAKNRNFKSVGRFGNHAFYRA
jgi:N-acetylmuramoyl-L-alanine amidase